MLINLSIKADTAMNYNERTYFRANPFYKQDFLPDRAWHNRVAKEYPSQLPSGVDFTPNIGRKGYKGKLNRSQIEEANVLSSPERYPYEHRIASDKSYMRSLHTIDIEGAASNTRVNQSLKYKHRAQQDLARRYNQPLPEDTAQDRKKALAMKTLEAQQSRSTSMSRYNPNPQQYHQASLPSVEKTGRGTPRIDSDYTRYVMHNSNHKFDPQHQPQAPYQQHQSTQYQPPTPKEEAPQAVGRRQNTPRQVRHSQPHQRSTTHYKQEYDPKQKYRDEYQRILQYEQMSRRIMQDPTRRRPRQEQPQSHNSFTNAAQHLIHH